MRVHFCGVRGSTPAPGTEFVRYGGLTSCVAIARDDADVPTLLLDAGTGLRRVTSLLGDSPFNGTILLSHLHWDHTHGLPFFKGGDRDDALVSLLLPDQLDGQTARDVLARGMSPPHFPIGPEGLRGTWRFETASPGTFSAEGFTVTALEVPHKGGRTFGYRVSDGHSTMTLRAGPLPDGPRPGRRRTRRVPRRRDGARRRRRPPRPRRPAAAETRSPLEASFGHAAADYAVGLGRAADARQRRALPPQARPHRRRPRRPRRALRRATTP